jgi:hypothetical protein
VKNLADEFPDILEDKVWGPMVQKVNDSPAPLFNLVEGHFREVFTATNLVLGPVTERVKRTILGVPDGW